MALHHKWPYSNMKIKLPEVSLVLLMGVSGSGKSTFARKHFLPSEVVSSDACRAIVSDDENSLAATKDAFDLLYYIVGKRLKNGLLTVVDATNVQPASRKGLVQLAKSYHVLPSLIVLDMPMRLCEDRNALREDRQMGSHVLRQQQVSLRKSLRGLKREGFRKMHFLRSEAEVDAVQSIERERLYNNLKHLKGPFDIVGDVHGCYEELLSLLAKLGYQVQEAPKANAENCGLQVVPPAGRTLVFVGDLVDRGPASPQVLKLAMSMVNAGTALCVPGNHEAKLLKWLKGKNVGMTHGLPETIEQLKRESPEFLKQVQEFLYSLISHYVFDDGKLVVSHAGLREEMHGRASGAVRSFCLFGETTGDVDDFGFPERYDWTQDYRGEAKVVFGHTTVYDAEWVNRCMDVDTGCVFGGKLTALRYPEDEVVSVPALKTYADLGRPLEPKKKDQYDNLLDIEDVIGKRIVQTSLMSNLTIREENSIAALEVMGRFAINPKWLIYLPPTMSPCETSQLDGYLEHPEQAIAYYRKRGIEKLICEEKHMGSRAVLVICKDEAAALERFGIKSDGFGKCYTRTGRNFFNYNQKELEQSFLEKVRQGLNKAQVWQQFNTDWICLDCELMPWSAKAQSLLQDQYAAVGTAAQHALSPALEELSTTKQRGIEGVEQLLDRYQYRAQAADKFVTAYQQYCWPMNSVEDFKLAPFHILATEGQVYSDKTHEWHMQKLQYIVESAGDIWHKTPFRIVNTNEPSSIDSAISWWNQLTDAGGEGMVVKPMNFISRDTKGKLLQPAVKCRGREYLRIIYGPDYDHPELLQQLRKRGLSRKRSLALREFALGLESLERFVQKDPLRKVHETVFAVLALESEEVDPRL